MEKLQVNMVFRNIKNEFDFRIVYISYDYSDIVCIQLNNEKALPYYDTTANIESQLNNNEIEFLENDPYFKIFDETSVQDRYLDARDQAFKYIKELCCLENISSLYDEKIRSRLIKDISKNFNVSKVTIYKNLRLFLQGGMTKNSLLTHINTTRKTNQYNKRGRKISVSNGE